MSPRQQAVVLQVIAGRMETLNDLLIMAQGYITDSETSVFIDAAQSMAEAIGAMADDATGGGVRGDMHCWLYGNLFSKLDATAGASSLGEAAQGRA